MKRLISICLLLIFIISGCSPKEEETLILETYNMKEDKYESVMIGDQEKVAAIKEILKEANWENAKIAFAGKPEFLLSLYTGQTDPNAKVAPSSFYNLWISPDKETLEISTKNKYVHLDSKASATLFALLTYYKPQ